jgi:hypothetical protein
MRNSASAILGLLLVGWLLSCQKAGEPPEKQEVRWVKARSGLILRQAPGRLSPPIGTIPQFDRVTVLGDSALPDSIDGKADNWVKVRWGDKTGFVFAAYLTSEDPKGLIPASVVVSRVEKVTNIEFPPGYRISRSFSNQAFVDELKVVRRAEWSGYKVLSLSNEEADCSWVGANCITVIVDGDGKFVFSDLIADGYAGLPVLIHPEVIVFSWTWGEGNADGCSFYGEERLSAYIFKRDSFLQSVSSTSRGCREEPPRRTRAERYSFLSGVISQGAFETLTQE